MDNEFVRKLQENGVLAVAKIPETCWKCGNGDQRMGPRVIQASLMGIVATELCLDCWNDFAGAFEEDVLNLDAATARTRAMQHTGDIDRAELEARKETSLRYFIRGKLLRWLGDKKKASHNWIDRLPAGVGELLSFVPSLVRDLELEYKGQGKPVPEYVRIASMEMQRMGLKRPEA